jgi:enoyl-CoA hydratase/carnithine racemase
MNEVIIEMVAQIVGTFALMLIGVVGTWLTAKIAKRNELANIAAATAEATDAARRVVLELQQTMVEGMKASCEDGKLSDSEIEHLGTLLLDKAMAQMSVPAMNVLASAGKDVSAIIQSAGEATILAIKKQ